jgi:hypothetical protein
MDQSAITEGDLRQQLTAVRDHLVDRLVTTQRADAIAPIGRLVVDVLIKLDELPNDAEGSVTDGLADELAKLRSQRTAGPGPAGRGEEAAGL